MLQRVKVWTCIEDLCHRQMSMNPAVPPALVAAADALLKGVSRKELAARASMLSQHYRAGGNSSATITDEMSAIAYLVSRLPATFAVAVAAFAAAREAAPRFTPKTLLDVGAGPGTASWAAIEIWPALQHVTMMDSNSVFLEMAKISTLDTMHKDLYRARAAAIVPRIA